MLISVCVVVLIAVRRCAPRASFGGRLADVGATRNRLELLPLRRAARCLAHHRLRRRRELTTAHDAAAAPPPRSPRRSARRTLSAAPWQPLWLRLRRAICPRTTAPRAKQTARRRSSTRCAPWWRRCEGILPRSGPSSGPTRSPTTSRRGPRRPRRTPPYPPCPACDHVFRKLICTWPRRSAEPARGTPGRSPAAPATHQLGARLIMKPPS